MKKELNILFTALMFYTRIPVPKIWDYSDEMLNKATRYFTLIGLIVGGCGALVFFLLEMILSSQLVIIMSMVSTILVTGAFHEDGFADFCDGFGGGYTKEKILNIMKDSRIGTYGATGLVLILGMKYFALNEMKAEKIPLVLIAGHAFSRFLPVLVIFTSGYVRDDLKSKAKPIGKKNKWYDLIIAAFFGLGFLYFIPWQAITGIALLSVLLFLAFRAYLLKKIGGYTGDALGALQQLAEVGFYLMYLVMMNQQILDFFNKVPEIFNLTSG
jgi:adenosylcobinamide-GDP ribazoletransferase